MIRWNGWRRRFIAGVIRSCHAAFDRTGSRGVVRAAAMA
jgi:hypothetical protein